MPLPSILSECTTFPTFTALNTYAPGCWRVISDGSKLISVSFTWIISSGVWAPVCSPEATDGEASSSCSSLPPPVLPPPPPQPTVVASKSRQTHPTTAYLNLMDPQLYGAQACRASVASSFPQGALGPNYGRLF